MQTMRVMDTVFFQGFSFPEYVYTTALSVLGYFVNVLEDQFPAEVPRCETTQHAGNQVVYYQVFYDTSHYKINLQARRERIEQLFAQYIEFLDGKREVSSFINSETKQR